MILALLVDKVFLMSLKLKDLCNEVCETDCIEQCVQVKFLVQAFICLIKKPLLLVTPFDKLSILETAA